MPAASTSDGSTVQMSAGNFQKVSRSHQPNAVSTSGLIKKTYKSANSTATNGRKNFIKSSMTWPRQRVSHAIGLRVQI